MQYMATLVAGIGLLATTLMATPSANADGLGGVSGWQPSPNVCGTGNTIPVLIGNGTDQVQTGSVTVPSGLAANVQIFTASEGTGTAQGCGRSETMQAPGYSYNFTVQPYSSTYFWVVLGGVDYNAIGDSHNIAFGGLPSNFPGGQSWYNMELSLTATESFSGLQANYEGTGGTNGNGQNGFNLVGCDTNTTNGTVNLSSAILTPYSSGDTNGPSYGWGDPVCAGWFPQGPMVSFDNMGQTADNAETFMYTTAAQINYNINGFSGNDTISFAGQGGWGLDGGLSYTITGNGLANDGVNVPLAAQPNGQDAFYTTISDGQWAAVNIPIYQFDSGTVTLFNGPLPIASYSWIN